MLHGVQRGGQSPLWRGVVTLSDKKNPAGAEPQYRPIKFKHLTSYLSPLTSKRNAPIMGAVSYTFPLLFRYREVFLRFFSAYMILSAMVTSWNRFVPGSGTVI